MGWPFYKGDINNAAAHSLVFKEAGGKEVVVKKDALNLSADVKELQQKLKKAEDELNKLRLKQVEKDQEIFENKKKN